MGIPARTTFELASEQLMMKVQEFWLPYRQVPDSLQRYCRPVAFYNENTPLELSVNGSAFLFRQRGHNLLLCCHHQLANNKRSAEELVVVVDDEGGLRRKGLAPHEATRIDPDPNLNPAYRDAEDIFLAEYRNREGSPSIDRHFLRFDLDAARDLNQVAPEDVDLIFTIGYPSAFADYDPEYDDDWETVGLNMVSRWVKLYLEPTGRNGWDSAALMPLKMRADQHEPLEKPDGMSGSPVFFIYGGRNPEIGFAGMIVRANKQGRINMLEARLIREAVSHHLSPPTP